MVDSTLATGIPPKDIGGWLGLMFLLEKMISTACLLISGLNFIFHWFAQAVILSRSLVRVKCACSTSFTLIKRDASSANSFMLDEIPSARSLMYIRKRRGPNTEP